MATVFPGVVKAARARQGFDRTGVEGLVTHAADEIREILEGAIGLTLCHDGTGGAFADALDRTESETDGVVLDDGSEVGVRLVYIRPKHLHAQGFDFRHEFRQLVSVALFGGQHGRHELDRVVGLQVGGLVRENGVGGGVRLIKAVFRELL